MGSLEFKDLKISNNQSIALPITFIILINYPSNIAKLLNIRSFECLNLKQLITFNR